MSKKEINNKKIKLLKLQKEYVQKAIDDLDKIIHLSQVVASSDDIYLIEDINEKIKTLQKKVDSNYLTACKIEEIIK